MISTRNLQALPNIADLSRLMQSMAMLDAILCPDWEFRYYSFNSGWTEGEQMGSMRDGSGNDLFVHFSSHGCWVKGFVHESEMTPYRQTPPAPWPGELDSVPSDFDESVNEPAFVITNTTFCIWRRHEDTSWICGSITFPEGDDPDGSKELLTPFDGKPETYAAWAAEYYEKEVSVELVAYVYAHRPLTEEVVSGLNPEVALDDLEEDILEIGYPAP